MTANKSAPQAANITKYIDSSSGLRATVINATEAVRKMQTIQHTYPIATMMVGRSMVAAALMAAQLKDGELVSLYFHGDGPIETVFAEASYEGAVRGYTPNPQLELDLLEGRLNLTAAIGKGTLSVVRTHPQATQPYRGTVEIQTGEIGDDVAYYLQQSQQARTVVALGVKINAYGHVQSAGGVIIDLLPEATPMIEIIVANRVSEAASLSEALASGASQSDVLKMYLDGFRMAELEHAHALNYSCSCTSQRLIRSLEFLPLADLDDILAKKEPIEAKCEFCGQQYKLPSTAAQAIRDKKFKNSLN